MTSFITEEDKQWETHGGIRIKRNPFSTRPPDVHPADWDTKFKHKKRFERLNGRSKQPGSEGRTFTPGFGSDGRGVMPDEPQQNKDGQLCYDCGASGSDDSVDGLTPLDEEEGAWCLPAVILDACGHRPKFDVVMQPFNALVVRVLTRREIAESPEAEAASKKEFDRFRGMKRWLEEKVQEEDKVKHAAQEAGEEAVCCSRIRVCQ